MPDTTPLPLPECPVEGCPAIIDHWHGGEGTEYPCTRQLGRACLGHESERSNIATRCYAPRNQPAPARATLRPLTEDDYRAAREAYSRAEHSYLNAAADAIHARLAADCQPAPAEDERIAAWAAIAEHPFFAPCYATAAPLLLSMLDRLDGLLDAQPAPQPPAVVLPTVDEVAARLLVYDVEIGNCSDDLTWANADRELQHEFREAARAVLDLIAARVPVWQPVEWEAIRPGMRVHWKRIDSDNEGAFTVQDVSDGRFYFDGGYVSQHMSYAWAIDPRTVPAEPDAALVETIAQAIAAGAGDSLDDLYRRDARAILDAIRAEYVIEPKAADQ